jgi:hypothetical protein
MQKALNAHTELVECAEDTDQAASAARAMLSLWDAAQPLLLAAEFPTQDVYCRIAVACLALKLYGAASGSPGGSKLTTCSFMKTLQSLSECSIPDRTVQPVYTAIRAVWRRAKNHWHTQLVRPV